MLMKKFTITKNADKTFTGTKKYDLI